MKCDRCDNESTIHVYIHHESEEENRATHLCADCARRAVGEILFKGEETPEEPGDKDGFQFFQDSLKQLVASFFEETEEDAAAGQDEHRCSFCGSSFREIMESGRLGCDHCYTEFQDRVRESLRMTQGATRHIGDVPTSQKERKELLDAIETKKQQLQELILVEDYEQAAQVRDEVRAMTAALGQEEA